MPNEPTLEELSSYLDHELDAATQARVAEHLAGCGECRARLDGLRQAAYAIRALPMETPRRTFTVPEKRRPAFGWAPVGWLGGAAAALLIVIAGINHGPAPSTAAGRSSSAQYAAAPNRQVAPLEHVNDAGSAALQQWAPASKSVTDPQNSARSLTISANATSYPASGVMTVHVTIRGLSAGEASSATLLLSPEGQGYSVRLAPPSSATSNPFDWQASYSIPQMRLQAPVDGSYRLQLTVTTSDHNNLTTWLPLTITA